ncbi:DNA repair protein [Phanerochaete sordida]|uniref:DNA repair protein n=1 Tax=Phanerochaete sordida TaxID=48140 RepID=A0A9P3FX96_9APHY|nr:DNA repair protein [Phanerochaete sordida]
MSPVFSPNPAQSETPETSDGEPQKPTKRATRPRRGAAANSKKRAAPSEDEADLAESAAVKRPAKRRNLAQVVVEVTSRRSARPVKQTAKSKVVASSVADEDELASDIEELEYDEQASIDESEDSGSEFQASDDEASVQDGDSEDEATEEQTLETLAEALEEDGVDADELLIDIATRASLQTARNNEDIHLGASSSGAGSSRAKEIGSAAATLRAIAAERRMAKKAETGKDVDDEEALDSDDEIDVLSDASSEPIAKGKGKVKAKTKAKAKPKKKEEAPKVMTTTELRKQRRAAARETRAERKRWKGLTQAQKNAIMLETHHPELKDVWGDVERVIPVNTPVKDPQPPGLKVTLLPFQQESLHWFKEQERGIWSGGMLADEMGMGKTIQMIALLVSDKGAKPNLVVAPTVAIMQWKNEIHAHSEGMEVLVWHGGTRSNDIKNLKKYDVVLTTYAILESCFRKQQSGFKRKGMIVKEKSVIHQIQWNRIILDEAHNIKERSTNTAKACFELKSKYKWCLSGTPLQNRVGELYSLIRFLGGDPFSYYFCKKCDCKSLHWKFSDKRTCDDCGHSPMHHTCFWNNEILTPIQKNGMMGPGRIAFKKLRVLLDRVMLRRTKIERADDLGLPPRTVIVRRDFFSPEEKELYLSLFSDAKRQFSTYVDQGTVLNNYSNIFSLLTRMRQMACHPDLVLRSKTNSGTFSLDDNGEATVCRLCNDIVEDAIQAKCRHIFDRECIKQYLNTAIEQTPACPVCHVPLTIDLEAPALELEENVKTRQGILGRLDLDKWRSSSKIEALIEELSNLRRQDATTKSIVFSQFVNFLDLIAYRLQKAGFTICRLEGTMSPQARDATIQHFMNNTHVTVFLVSLKAGGVALNLTEASRVYLMDSWWNPAVEYQAMDRIHRLGQHRPVQAIKLVIEDSIESRIIQLQEKKSAMVNATLSTDDSAMGRLTPQDLSFLFRL